MAWSAAQMASQLGKPLAKEKSLSRDDSGPKTDRKTDMDTLPDMGHDVKAKQRAVLLAELRKAPISTIRCRDALGIASPAPRVHELRRQGYRISTSRTEARDMLGRLHRGVALYTLHHEPQGASA